MVSIQLKKPYRLISVVFLGVVILTCVLLADYSFARREGRSSDSSSASRQREKRSSDSSSVSRQRESSGSGSSRVSEQRERRRSNSSRVSGQRDIRGSDSSRVTRYRSKKRITSPRVTRYGHVVRKLPRGYRRVWHKNKPYFYFGGVFYSPGPSGFVVVRAPIGSVVVSLPIGYRRLWIGGSWFYTYGGTFYRRAPTGFVVVAPPAEVVFEEDLPVVVQPPEGDAGQASVTASILNVRLGPGLSYPIIYQVHRGYILEIHGRANEWLYVELPNGEFGWVMAAFTYRLQAPGSG